MTKFRIRAIRKEDIELLEKWRSEVPPEIGVGLPHGYDPRYTGIAVAERENGEIICALAGTISVFLGPVIKNPGAKPTEIVIALKQLTRAIEFVATGYGAVDSYIVVQDTLPEFQQIVEKEGYEKAEDGPFGIFSKDLTGQEDGSVEGESAVELKGE